MLNLTYTNVVKNLLYLPSVAVTYHHSHDDI